MKRAIDKTRSIGGLQSLLATVRSLDPATTAELGALHNLRLHVAAPLHQMIEEALIWLENIDALVNEQMPTLGISSPASSLPQSWRVLWQMSFSAQCDLTEAARDLDLTGCGWEEGLQRCETASRQIKEALRQVVGAVDDLDHLERLEANAKLAGGLNLGRRTPPPPLPGVPTRQRLARGSQRPARMEPTPSLARDPALRPTERYPEAIIEQLCAESERESLEVRTIGAPEAPLHRIRAQGSEQRIAPPQKRVPVVTRAPLTLEGE